MNGQVITAYFFLFTVMLLMLLQIKDFLLTIYIFFLYLQRLFSF